MIKIPQLNITVFKNLTRRMSRIKKLPWIFGMHAFLTLLVLILLTLILGALIFYKYNVLIKKEEPKVIEKPLQLEEKTYQKIVSEWQKREKRFIEASQKEYSDPFREKEEELNNSNSETNHTNNTDNEETLIYSVVEGETLWDIAQRYLGSGHRWNEITTETGGTFTDYSAEVLQPGQKLIIPLR